MRQGADAFPGGHDLGDPGPAGPDLEAPLATAAGQAGGGVQEAQGVRLGLGEAAVDSEELELTWVSSVTAVWTAAR